jgi:class 3 adenylate cyclase
MTQPEDEAKTSRKIVLFFDFCSSTSILEDLLRTENQVQWRNILIHIKEYLQAQRETVGFEIYKFIGDGWVLLIDEDADPLVLMMFLRKLCKTYQKRFKQRIQPLLSSSIPVVGITFGLDKGTIVRVHMNDTKEYIGRPLNVAARLQGAIKDNDSEPQGKVLMSNNVYAAMKKKLAQEFRVQRAKRDLRNISGGKGYLAKKLWLFSKPTE